MDTTLLFGQIPTIGKRYLHCLEILLDPENPCTLPYTRFPLFPSRPCYLDKTKLFEQQPTIGIKPYYFDKTLILEQLKGRLIP